MSVMRRGQQWGTFARVWHIYDATWQDPFQSAQRIKHYLMGLYKPIYHPTNDCGDHVVVINSKEIALRGDEWRKRVYFHHTTYIRGASWTLAWELHTKDPTMIMKKAVYTSMDGNLQRRLGACDQYQSDWTVYHRKRCRSFPGFSSYRMIIYLRCAFAGGDPVCVLFRKSGLNAEQNSFTIASLREGELDTELPNYKSIDHTSSIQHSASKFS
ncbi:hypothetical protein KM043_013281 [Ampulex compressa]|nr:hypothetical protein KM043_013281 [Ampulex compressa]